MRKVKNEEEAERTSKKHPKVNLKIPNQLLDNQNSL
jgi:hypothetical protein